MEITITPLILFILCALMHNQHISLLITLLIMISIKLLTKGIANADIVIIAGCSNCLEIEKIGIFLTLIGIVALILNKNQTKFPLIPSITIAFLITTFTHILNNFIMIR